MRRFGKSALIIGILLFFAPPAFASKCPNASVPNGFANYVHETLADHEDDLLFVFVDRNGGYDPAESVSTTLDRKKSVVRIPDEVIRRASPEKTVRVYHRGKTFAYLIPIDLDKMKDEFRPQNQCAEAREKNRVVGLPPPGAMGCEVIDLTGVSAGTILYDQSATSCRAFQALTEKLRKGQVKRGSKDVQDLAAAIDGFNAALGTNNKVGDFTNNRAPGFSKITYATGKTQEIGEPEMEPAKKKADAGKTTGRGD